MLMRKGMCNTAVSPFDLATYCCFAASNRTVDTNFSIIQLEPNILILTDNTFLISQNILADLKGPKGKHNLLSLYMI